MVHLGDYIYENGGDGQGRAHTGGEVQIVTDYRKPLRLYRGDPALRAAHAAFPWVVTWDDHEVDNNYAGLIPEDMDPAEGNDRFPARRAAAYQAYYESMPIRVGDGGTGKGCPVAESFPIYRGYRYVDPSTSP